MNECKRGHDKSTVGKAGLNYCRACANENQKKSYYHRKEEKRIRAEKSKAYYHRSPSAKNRRWEMYGIRNSGGSLFTIIDFDYAYQVQQGRCKICGVHQSDHGRALAVDHNHKTGFFRSLLCVSCNTKVAVIESDVYPKALEYLKAHGQ
jgi:hypothetical protein